MIEVKNLTFKYESNKILDNLSLIIKDNESVGIIGANGKGKTTLLKLFVGLIQNYEGEISIDDLIVNNENITEIKKRCGFLFQDSDNQLFMNRVFDDIAFGPVNLGVKNINEKIDEVLKELSISDLKERVVHTLSGGEKKLVSIAGILVLKPKYVFMDEPSNTLDPKNRRNIINIINNLDCTKVITSHDLDLIYDTCPKVVLINNGKIVKYGTRDEILKDKKLLEDNDLELPLRFQYN